MKMMIFNMIFWIHGLVEEQKEKDSTCVSNKNVNGGHGSTHDCVRVYNWKPTFVLSFFNEVDVMTRNPFSPMWRMLQWAKIDLPCSRFTYDSYEKRKKICSVEHRHTAYNMYNDKLTSRCTIESKKM